MPEIKIKQESENEEMIIFDAEAPKHKDPQGRGTETDLWRWYSHME